MIKTAYTIATKIGSSGLGTVSKYAIKALKEHDYLTKGICYNNISDIKNLISVPFNPFKPVSFFSKRSYYPLKKSFFDFIASQILKKYDFNVLHTWLNQSLYTMNTAKKKGAKIILECGSTHPLFRNELIKQEYEEINLTYNKININEMDRALKEIEMADYILTPSNFARQTFIEKKLSESKVFVAPRGVNTSKFFPASKNEEPIKVIFAGHLGIRKGVHYLLDAWKYLKIDKTTELLLLGDVQDDFKPFLKKYFALGNIKFIGFTHEPWNYFNKAHIFIFPTLEEGSAKVVYEAMASGMAVITTENAGSIIENNKDGIIIPIKNSAEIYNKLELLINNKDLRNYLSFNAINKVKNYTWKNYQEKLINFYNKNIL